MWAAWLSNLYAGMFAAMFFWGVLIAVAILEICRPAARPTWTGGSRITVNLVLGGLGFLLQLVPMLTATGVALLAAEHQWGLLNHAGVPLIVQVVLSILLFDLMGYGLHRLSHRNRWLWRIHRVHHSDAEIDLSTLLRSHPLNVPVILAFEGVVIVALGLHPLGAMLHGSAKLVTMALGHAAVKPAPRLSGLCAKVLVTPAFHQRHHSAWQPETDSNYGEVLTIWDRLFGTVSPADRPVARYGLGPRYDAQSDQLAAQLRLPFQPD